MTTYTVINEGTFRYLYKAGEITPIFDIYLTLGGSQIEEVSKSDSLLSYSLQCRSLSLRYAKEDPKDILLDVDGSIQSGNVPVDLLFLKRNKAIYMMLLISKSEFEHI